jgi:HAD superfamily hydrolase (TIGR01509 family)
VTAQGVILDMDGLMLDTGPFYKSAWQEAVRRLGYRLSDEVFRSFSGKSDADSEAALLAELGPRFPLRRFQATWPELWQEEVRASGVPTKPGIPRLLETLRRHQVPTAVATSSPARRTELALRVARIAEFFAAVVTCEAVGRGKPAPDIFLEAARRLELPPSACVVLEDSDSGAQAAAAAGMRVIVIPDRLPPSHQTRALAAAIHADAETAIPVLLEFLGADGVAR